MQVLLYDTSTNVSNLYNVVCRLVPAGVALTICTIKYLIIFNNTVLILVVQIYVISL